MREEASESMIIKELELKKIITRVEKEKKIAETGVKVSSCVLANEFISQRPKIAYYCLLWEHDG